MKSGINGRNYQLGAQLETGLKIKKLQRIPGGLAGIEQATSTLKTLYKFHTICDVTQ